VVLPANIGPTMTWISPDSDAWASISAPPAPPRDWAAADTDLAVLSIVPARPGRKGREKEGGRGEKTLAWRKVGAAARRDLMATGRVPANGASVYPCPRACSIRSGIGAEVQSTCGHSFEMEWTIWWSGFARVFGGNAEAASEKEGELEGGGAGPWAVAWLFRGFIKTIILVIIFLCYIYNLFY
jgi:hypothetical protein